MTYRSVAVVLALVGLTKKRFGHYAILKILSLKSPRTSSALYSASVYHKTFLRLYHQLTV